MPLCGIISSECLGTLPGAWAKQCENVPEVNCCEWLWDTAWTSCPGPLRHIRGCPSFPARESTVRCHLLLPAPGLFVTFCFPFIIAECPLSKMLCWLQRVRQAEFYIQKYCPDNSCLQISKQSEDRNNNQWLRIIPCKQSSESIKQQKQCANVSKPLQVSSIYYHYFYINLFILRGHTYGGQRITSTMWIPGEIRLQSLDLATVSLALSVFETMASSQGLKPSLQQCVKKGKRLARQFRHKRGRCSETGGL